MDNDKTALVDQFSNALVDFDEVFARVPEEGLDWTEKEGEWSVRQVVHHVTEDLTVYGFILEQALALPDAKVVFGNFPGNDAWANSMGFDQRPVANALALMHAQRAYFAELISQFPDRWENKLQFFDQSGKKLTESSVRQMITMLTDHMLEHVRMIENILKVHEI
jgi:hypothetical protein